MSRFIGVICIGLVFLEVNIACDICACNIGMQGVGLHQLVHSNVLGMSYSGTTYTSKHTTGVRDEFRKWSLQATYFPAQNIKLNAFIPYQWNIRRSREQIQRRSGIGDMQLMAHYILNKDFGTCQDLKFTVDFGAGIKLPSGNYDPDLHSKNLPENFNIGNGHYALVFQPSIALSKINYGILISGNYQYNLRKNATYGFGNQYGILTTFFYELNVFDNLKIIPTLGFQWEYSEKDVYETGFRNSDTGGKGVLLPLGFSARWIDFVVQSSYSVPLSQNYASGSSQLDSRFVCQLHYFF